MLLVTAIIRPFNQVTVESKKRGTILLTYMPIYVYVCTYSKESTYVDVTKKNDLSKTQYFTAGTAPLLKAGPQGSSRRRDDSR